MSAWGDAWEQLLGDGEDDQGELTELEKVAVHRVDGVSIPANGEGWLLMKAQPSSPAAASALAWLGFATRDFSPLPSRADLRPVPGIAGRVIKAEPERRFTLCLAYGVDRPDLTRAQDGYRDMAGADAVEQAAWEFLAKSRQIGLFHANGTEGAGEVVESYVHRGPPWLLKNAAGQECRVGTGDWLLGVIWSPEAWRLIKSGKVTGVSMQGDAVRRRPSPETLARVRARRDGRG
jgi:hypothetical protein